MQSTLKRCLSFVLALVMVLSLLPGQAFAAGTEEHDHDHASEQESTQTQSVSTETEESEALIALRAEIAAHVEELGITPDMPDVMLLYAYGNHASYEEAQASVTKLDEFEQKAMQLSKAEQKILAAEENTKLCIRYRDVVAEAYGVQTIADCAVAGVKFETQSTNSNVTANDTKVTATVKGNDGGCNGTDTANTMVLYITNTSGTAGAVSFDIALTNVNKIVVGDANGNPTSESLKEIKKYTK
ncbi:MAG: hypothetical protein IKV65_06760, partial [Erysipelotrichaceae bacterium]|nr:hypothetical protein [Erysipelotrichaceae bacterium]